MYAIEKSAIAQRAKEIVEVNGFSDKITVIQAAAEDAELPVDKARAHQASSTVRC